MTYSYIRARVDGVWLTVTWRLAEHRVLGWWRGRLEGVMRERSQVQLVGGPPPQDWDDYEHGCLMTFGGGYQTAEERSIFQHCMSTVFNLLRAEFPPAEQCKAAPDLLATLQTLADDNPPLSAFRSRYGDIEAFENSDNYGDVAMAAMYRMAATIGDKARDAIAKATGAVEQARRVAGCGDETSVEVKQCSTTIGQK